MSHLDPARTASADSISSRGSEDLTSTDEPINDNSHSRDSFSPRLRQLQQQPLSRPLPSNLQFASFQSSTPFSFGAAENTAYDVSPSTEYHSDPFEGISSKADPQSQAGGLSQDTLLSQASPRGTMDHSFAAEAAADMAQSFYDPFQVKHRRRTTPGQLKILENQFETNNKPDISVRKSLADRLGMTPREVQVWFQNRRAKAKRMAKKASDYGSYNVSSTASYDPNDEFEEVESAHWSIADPSQAENISDVQAMARRLPYPTGEAFDIRAAQTSTRSPDRLNLSNLAIPSGGVSAAPHSPEYQFANFMQNPYRSQPSDRSEAASGENSPEQDFQSYIRPGRKQSDAMSSATGSSYDLHSLAGTGQTTPVSVTSSFSFSSPGEVFPPGFDPDSRRASCPAEFVASFNQLGVPPPAALAAGHHIESAFLSQHPNSNYTSLPPSLAAHMYAQQRRHSVGFPQQSMPVVYNSIPAKPFQTFADYSSQPVSAPVPPQSLSQNPSSHFYTQPHFLPQQDSYGRRMSAASPLDRIEEQPYAHPQPRAPPPQFMLNENATEEMGSMTLQQPPFTRKARSQSSIRNVYRFEVENDLESHSS